jgi:hypothetical protein
MIVLVFMCLTSLVTTSSNVKRLSLCPSPLSSTYVGVYDGSFDGCRVPLPALHYRAYTRRSLCRNTPFYFAHYWQMTNDAPS